MSEPATRLGTALSGRYRIERELGQGGMATVYLAHDVKHDRDVAIKVLHPELAAALGGDRFLSEIKTTAKLQHPHILPLLDSGEGGGFLYYVMPYVTGETLRARLDRERQLPIDDALRIAREVADALGCAHALGIIHRDIKPENILLQGGHALVADFGIALAVQQAGGARMTQTGLSLGTPQYMSPEQAMGEKSVDARADVYALGAVTYEMLTGDAPFTGTTVQAIVAKVLSAQDDPAECRRGRADGAGEVAGRPVRDGRGVRGGAEQHGVRGDERRASQRARDTCRSPHTGRVECRRAAGDRSGRVGLAPNPAERARHPIQAAAARRHVRASRCSRSTPRARWFLHRVPRPEA
jgi:serine/threonine protein kinase